MTSVFLTLSSVTSTVLAPDSFLLTSAQGGIVAGSFVITRSLKFRIRVAAAQTNTFIVFSAKYIRYRCLS